MRTFRRSVQRQISPSPTKSQIKYFVDTYGFNARAAYAYAVDPQKYEVQLNNDLFLTPPFEMIQWFNITRLLSMVDNDYSTDSDAHPFQGILCHPSRRNQERPGYHDPQ
ncbi:hypothetical protein CVT26_008805 [Gymnopilus dilepis]|uniref:Uncharacterized protein n=1 Tax=Gymnopilus dilepis TaxID=231916 RepID=A0A409X6Y7_9AGAR|nr:hypothetical protein CVT26_008805 [Gymnopilus dilepis]